MSEHADQLLSPATGGLPAGVTSGPGTGGGVGGVGALPWAATWVLLLCIAAIINAFLVAGAHGTRGFFLSVLTAVVCVLAGLFDGWTQRIPNPITYTAILLGVGLNAVVPLLGVVHAQAGITWLGAAGPGSSLMGFAMCAAMALAASFFAGVHGGDLKLLAAVGALTGFETTCNLTLLALLLALAYAVVNLVMLGRLTLVLRVAAQRMLELFYLRKFQTPIPGGGKPTHIPMAIPLAVAAIVGIVMQVRFGTWRVV